MDSAIDKFLPELLYTTVRSIEYSTKVSSKDISIYKEEALKSLHIILKCLKMKTAIFKQPSKTRRKPPSFGKATLQDIALWMLKQSRNCLCRRTGQMLFNSFVEVSKRINDCNDCAIFLQNHIKNISLDVFIVDYLEPLADLTMKTLQDFKCLVKTLSRLISSVDAHILICKHQLLECRELFDEERVKKSKLFLSMDVFLGLMVSGTSDAEFHKSSDGCLSNTNMLDDLLFKLWWKYTELLVAYANYYEDVIIIDRQLSNVFKSMVDWLSIEKKLSILQRNVNTVGFWCVKEALQHMKEASTRHWDIFIKKFYSKIESHASILLVSDCRNIKNIPPLQNVECIDEFVEIFDISNDHDIARDSLKRIFANTLNVLRSIFDTFFKPVGSADWRDSTDCRESLRIIIKFALYSKTITVKQVMEFSINQSEKVCSEKQTPEMIFLKMFEDQLIPFFMLHHLEFFQVLTTVYGHNTFVIKEIMIYLIAKKVTNNEFMESLTNYLMQVILLYSQHLS